MCDHLMSADFKVKDELSLLDYVLLSDDAIILDFYSGLATLLYGVLAPAASTGGWAGPGGTSFG